jgi:uncharacterized OsmC-like protein/pimeloyl-ACP methyl ester carboxylesterase
MSARREKIEFPGSQGTTLSALLDLPQGEPRAYALFAHGFTLSKDVFAAARISQGLAARGIAVLRFDFTGLGASEGEFANTNFSSNVEDLVAAADWLRENRAAPEILVGHSLGGAAVLAAAAEIAEAKAVATINAPADPSHLAHLFAPVRDEIEARGEAEVTIGGRTFCIRKQFLDDIEGQRLSDIVAHLRKALLIFHAPRDEVVSIDNASTIFLAAKHPKSFVSLDAADHLLSRKEDAVYAAEVLAAWASRYIGAANREESEAAPAFALAPGELVVYETGTGKFAQIVDDGRHRLRADEPENFGGDDTGPSPYAYLAAALGACTSMTLRLYAARKQWPVDRIAVRVRHRKVHVEDCAECEEKDGKIDQLEREIDLQGDLTEEQRERLMEIADRCPVHKTLEHHNQILTRLRAPSA